MLDTPLLMRACNHFRVEISQSSLNQVDATRTASTTSTLSLLCALMLDDLADGRSPSDPSEEAQRIVAVAVMIRERIRRREGVIVHCDAGNGRTGTVLACVLIELGLGSCDADRVLRQAGVGWPESPWHEELVGSYLSPRWPKPTFPRAIPPDLHRCLQCGELRALPSFPTQPFQCGACARELSVTTARRTRFTGQSRPVLTREMSASSTFPTLRT